MTALRRPVHRSPPLVVLGWRVGAMLYEEEPGEIYMTVQGRLMQRASVLVLGYRVVVVRHVQGPHILFGKLDAEVLNRHRGSENSHLWVLNDQDFHNVAKAANGGIL